MFFNPYWVDAETAGENALDSMSVFARAFNGMNAGCYGGKP